MRNWLVNTHQGLIEPILEGRLGSPYENKIRSFGCDIGRSALVVSRAMDEPVQLD